MESLEKIYQYHEQDSQDYHRDTFGALDVLRQNGMGSEHNHQDSGYGDLENYCMGPQTYEHYTDEQKKYAYQCTMEAGSCCDLHEFIDVLFFHKCP